MRVQERYDQVLQAIEDLREASLKAPVIVEGKNDGRALRSLGIRGAIIRLNSGSSVFQVCEDVSRQYSEAVILTDWDHRGGHLCRLLMEGLAANGVRYNVEIRARLTRLCKKEVKDVEGLATLVERISRPEKESSRVRRVRGLSKHQRGPRRKV
jgi:dTMP kinase